MRVRPGRRTRTLTAGRETNGRARYAGRIDRRRRGAVPAPSGVSARERRVDEASEESFPASDAPSTWSREERGRPRRSRARPRSTPGSSSVERSPGSSPSTVARTARRTIFALRVFGSAVVKRTSAGAKALPSSSAQRARRRARSSSLGSLPGAQHAEAPHDLALDLVRHADRAGLGDRRVADERRLVLGRADALAGDVERVVGAAVQEPVAVGVDRRPVAVRPDAGEAPPVGLEVALGVAPDAARHAPARAACRRARRPRRAAGARPGRRRPSPCRAAALRACRACARRYGGSAEEGGGDLGAARDVHDRLGAAADALEEPQPRIGVPGLAGRAERPQRRRGRRPSASSSPACRSARTSVGETPRNVRRWRSASRQMPPRVGVVGRAVVEQRGEPEAVRVREQPRAHDPADVGQPVDAVAGLEVAGVAALARDLDEESAVHVHGALGPAGRARGVGEHERVLGVDRASRAASRATRDELVPPDVAPVLPRDGLAGVAHDDRRCGRPARARPPRRRSPWPARGGRGA